MISTKILEEKLEYLFNLEMRGYPIKLVSLNVEIDVSETKIEDCSIFIHGNYLGPADGEVWAVRRVIEYISDAIYGFFSKYKLQSNGKITTKEKQNYYVDDLIFLEINYVLDEKFEFKTSIKILEDE